VRLREAIDVALEPVKYPRLLRLWSLRCLRARYRKAEGAALRDAIRALIDGLLDCRELP
jgi:hypothetical protein